MKNENWHIDLKEMMEAGVHFGHQSRKWNPKMAPYIFTQRRGIHIIHLPKTATLLFEACEFIANAASKKKQFLIVGTRSQAADLVAAAAKKARCHYINKKWLGGMLTNWSTTKTRLQRLRQLEAQEMAEIFETLPKKESAVLKRQLNQLRKYLDGVKYMTALPDVVIIIDQQQDATTIQECQKLGIPTICLVDTDCDPDLTNMPIPANNDARGSIKWILDKFVVAMRANQNLNQNNPATTLSPMHKQDPINSKHPVALSPPAVLKTRYQ